MCLPSLRLHETATKRAQRQASQLWLVSPPGSFSEEMYREQSFCSTQTGSWTTASSSSDNLSRFRASNTSRDYKLKMMVKTFLESNGFMHINEAQHVWGRTRTLLAVGTRNTLKILRHAWRSITLLSHLQATHCTWQSPRTSLRL